MAQHENRPRKDVSEAGWHSVHPHTPASPIRTHTPALTHIRPPWIQHVGGWAGGQVSTQTSTLDFLWEGGLLQLLGHTHQAMNVREVIAGQSRANRITDPLYVGRVWGRGGTRRLRVDPNRGDRMSARMTDD